MDVDLAVVGAGGAGLSLLVQLDRRLPTGRPAPRIALVDPVRHHGDDRTWCFWDGGSGPLDAAVHRSWTRAGIVDTAGRARTLDLGPLRYVMIRSSAFYALAETALHRLGVVRIVAPADEVTEGRVRAGGVDLRPRWIMDSRPAPPRRRANTALLQHFRGWTVEVDRDLFDPELPVLMDFSVAQPTRGVAFGYVLPSSARRALVEYTEFSPARLPEASYERALRSYLHRRYGLAAPDYTVDHVEDGAVPMTDAVYARRVGPSTMRIGTAGGATRGATGYTFAAMQRQAAALADALVAGRPPVPPPAYPARHRWMDAVMLRALDRGLTPGPELFVRLFDRNPAERVLRFLDGTSSVGADLRLMTTAPVPTMTRAALGDAGARLGRRLYPVRRAVTPP